MLQAICLHTNLNKPYFPSIETKKNTSFAAGVFWLSKEKELRLRERA